MQAADTLERPGAVEVASDFDPHAIARLIAARLATTSEATAHDYRRSRIGSSFAVVDDLLPPELAMELFQTCPSYESLAFKARRANFRKNSTNLSVQMSPHAEAVIAAMQHPEVV